MLYLEAFYSLPYDKILDLAKFKVFADYKTILTEEFRFNLGEEENIVGKGENAGYQFCIFLSVFKSLSFPGSLKLRIVRQKVILCSKDFNMDKSTILFCCKNFMSS